jgi:uncharacterized protein (TIGR01777 family)
MQNKKIIIAGGSGFIGEGISEYFGKENQIIVLTRETSDSFNNRNKYSAINKGLLNLVYEKWNASTFSKWVSHLENSDVLINLAGKSVNCRYNKKNKQEIIDSRINSTKVLGEAIRLCKSPPSLWINASSATIYRHAQDRPQDELNGEYHDDFSVQVCKKWEKTFFDQTTPNSRKIALRMAITLGPGGVLIPYFNLLKFGLGGKQGDGKQMFSWVHVVDTCRMIEWIYSQSLSAGIYNCCSPNPVSNVEFMNTLRKVTGHKFGLPAPKLMLKIGAGLIGTETELILKSRWVLPAKILKTGFEFKFPKLENALKEIVEKVPRRQYHFF